MSGGNPRPQENRGGLQDMDHTQLVRSITRYARTVREPSLVLQELDEAISRAFGEGGVVSTFDAVYHDVIANDRLVYSYTMHLDDKKISVSLATIQLRSENAGTALTVTEQGAFLDGYDDAGSREQGTGHLLDALGESLRE